MAKLPKHYSLKGEHQHSYEVHDSRDKSSFHIAKKDMDLQMHAKLANLPHYFEGTQDGEVGAPGPWDSGLKMPTAEPSEFATNLADTWDRAAAPIATPLYEAASTAKPPININQPAPEESAPVQQYSPPPVAATPVASAAPQPRDAASQFLGNQAIAAKGYLDIGRAQERENTDKAAQIQVSQDAMAQANESYKNTLAQKHAELDNLSESIMSQKIDPSNFVHSMGTGNRILAGIAMALGGAGAAMAHQPNLAYDVIQKSIDRDIEAQKADLGKKQSLYSKNIERYHDEQLAHQATVLEMNAAARAQLDILAAKSGAQQAMPSAQILRTQLLNGGLGTAEGFAQRATALKAAKDPNVDPAILVPHLVPAAEQSKVFKEIEMAQNTRKMGDSILKNFEDAAIENTVMRTGGGMLRTPGSVLSLHQALQPTFADLEGTVRQAAMDNTFKNITPAPGDSEHTIQQKRDTLEHYLQSKSSAPTAKGFGIDLSKFGSTSPSKAPAKTIERQDSKTGKIYIYDANTKKNLGLKQ